MIPARRVCAGDVTISANAISTKGSVSDGIRAIGKTGDISITHSGVIGAEGFGCHYRFRGPSGAYDGAEMQLDFVKMCEGMGAKALEVRTLPELTAALDDARAGSETVCIVVQTDWHERVRGYANSWWEMATPMVSEMPMVPMFEDFASIWATAAPATRSLATWCSSRSRSAHCSGFSTPLTPPR